MTSNNELPARMMDPQRRLFLHCAWHALEDPGYDPAQVEGSTDDAPVQLDADTALPVHAVELRGYRSAGVLHLDWWYDSRRVDSTLIHSLADRFKKALLDLLREAITEEETDSLDEELTLVDLT